MPAVYLAPPARDAHSAPTGDTESHRMGRLANYLAAILPASGIACTRTSSGMSTGAAVHASNRGEYDLHLILRTRSAPEGGVAQIRGVVIFHPPNSPKGRRAAQCLAAHLGRCYPLPHLVTTQDTAAGVVTRVRAPCVLLQLGCHDHPGDAVWVSEYLPDIALAIAQALAEYFGMSPCNPDSVTDFL